MYLLAHQRSLRRNSLPITGTPGPVAPPGFSLLGASWNHLGRSSGRLERLFAPLGVALVVFCALLGSPWTHFFDFGADFGFIRLLFLHVFYTTCLKLDFS